MTIIPCMRAYKKKKKDIPYSYKWIILLSNNKNTNFSPFSFSDCPILNIIVLN